MIQLPQNLYIRNNEYRILTILGQGAYGRVFLAENNSIKYAIKEQDCFAQNELEFYIKMLSKQNKPFRNVINILAIEQIGRHTYIVMEQAESSLYEQILNNTFPKKNIRYVMKEIANGIRELHDIELTHRDIKPENILIKTIRQDNLEQQVYKICDFGTIKQSKNLVTQKLGTPYYISPEQLNKQPQQYSNKVDIWAFGAMCYELLTGDILFNAMTTEEIENKILYDDVKIKIQSLKDVEEDYKNLLILMLERDPNKRCDINQVIKKLEPRHRSVSRNSSNQQTPSNPSIRGNNYFIQSQQNKKRSVSGLDSEIENNAIKTVSKSPIQFQPNYRPPLHLQQDQKFNIKPSQTMQTNSQINSQFSTLQSQKQRNPQIFVKKLDI